MSRIGSGQVVERVGKRGTVWALRFRAYGERQYATLGSAGDGWTRARAEVELENVLADVRRGIWRPPVAAVAAVAPKVVPTFHQYAAEWLAQKTAEGLKASTLANYTWALELHLLPDFGSLPLDAIDEEMVDRWKVAKLAEGRLSARTVNQCLVRMSQVYAKAIRHRHVAFNPAAGRDAKLKAGRPSRPQLEVEQWPALLDAAAHYLAGRGRPLLATLAGGGLRIGEALALRWADVNLAKGELHVLDSKTAAGRRTVDLAAALREDLTVWRATSKHTRPTDLVFCTLTGRPDSRQVVRQRLLLPAVERANKTLSAAGMAPIGPVGLHSMRRLFASMRCADGADPVYVAAQLGHVDALFTMRVYATAAKHRAKLTPVERAAFDRALDWARMGTSETEAPEAVAVESAS